MSTTSYTLVILAALCLTASFADETGIVSVSIKNTVLAGGQASEYQQEFVEFDYEAVEWNGDVANWENEWSVEEDGVGEFDLTNQYGDTVIIRAHNDEDRNADLAGILGTKATSPAGGLTTIASNVGNSIAAAHERLQNPTVAAPSNSMTSNADNDVVLPLVVPDVVEAAVPDSVIVVEAVESAPFETENAPEVLVIVANPPAEGAVQDVENTPEEVVQVAESAPEEVVEAVEQVVSEGGAVVIASDTEESSSNLESSSEFTTTTYTEYHTTYVTVPLGTEV